MQTRRLFVLEITARSDPEAISPNLLRFRRQLMRQYIDSPAFEADSSCPWGEPVRFSYFGILRRGLARLDIDRKRSF